MNGPNWQQIEELSHDNQIHVTGNNFIFTTVHNKSQRYDYDIEAKIQLARTTVGQIKNSVPESVVRYDLTKAAKKLKNLLNF